MNTLAIDVGSSSVKARPFTDGQPVGALVRVAYPTIHEGLKVEVDPATLLQAVASATSQATAAPIDVVALSVMSPAWVAMDKHGQALTSIVIHQDRRAVEIARQLENRVGKDRHLALAGNRPFPGGISSTTCAWFLAHHPQVMAHADLVGHLNTFLIRRLTGARVIDPSNASFTGLYLTCQQSGWSDELCSAVGINPSLLPEIIESDVIAGYVTETAAAQFGLPSGVPVIAGMIDTSAAMYLTGANPGQLFHMCGSTDVLAVVAHQPRPCNDLLTRALGIGPKWMSVATIAAGGSSLDWMHGQFFHDLSDEQFHALTAALPQSAVHFDPYLAGERTSIEQKQAAFSGLTLATSRNDMLAAVVQALASASSARLVLLQRVQPDFLPDVFISGGAACLAELMHRSWPPDWRYHPVHEAGLAGLARIVPRSSD